MKKSIFRRGNSMIEFTLVGIPLMFVLISIFEIARGMWVYHTLAYAMKEATRFVIVKGADCASPNTCGVTVKQIVNVIKDRSVGLEPAYFEVTLSSATLAPVTCAAITDAACSSNSTPPWPQSPDNIRGNDITITGRYKFYTALSLFWPGSRGQQSAGLFLLGASSKEMIQF